MVSIHEWQGVAWGSESVTKGLTHLNIFLFGDKISTFLLLLLIMEELRGLYPRRKTQESLFRFTWEKNYREYWGTWECWRKKGYTGKRVPEVLAHDPAFSFQILFHKKSRSLVLKKRLPYIVYILSASLPKCYVPQEGRCHCPTEDSAFYQHFGQWSFPASAPGHGQ